MNRALQTYRALSGLVNQAFAKPGTGDKSVAQKVLANRTRPDTSPEYRTDLSALTKSRGITTLVHFTRIENLDTILTHGLIPRELLEHPVFLNALGPRFSDFQRLENRKELSFLSVSFPDYRMFWSKASEDQEKWAVLEFEPGILELFKGEFFPRNASRRKEPVYPRTGIEGAKLLFADPILRKQLQLPLAYTTDPAAQVAVRKVLDRSLIRAIHLHREANISPGLQAALAESEVPLRKSGKFFKPREDWEYWRKDGPMRIVDDLE